MRQLNIGTKTILAATFTALVCCGSKKADPDDDSRIVAASFYPMYVAALNIVENVPGIRVVVMAKHAASYPREYQFTSADATLIESAEALIINGGGMETFLDRAVSQNSSLTLIDASAGADFIIERVENGKREKSRDDHDHNDLYAHHQDDDYAHNTNAHVWMSIDNHIRQIGTIAWRLASWDTANAGAYNENARNYIEKLASLRENFTRELSGVSDDNRVIAISHNGFLYLARDLGLRVAAVLESSHGAEPGAAEIDNIINAVKKETPKALFTERGNPSAAAKTVSSETGLPIFELDMATAPLENVNDRDAYIRAMENNLATIKRALK